MKTFSRTLLLLGLVLAGKSDTARAWSVPPTNKATTTTSRQQFLQGLVAATVGTAVVATPHTAQALEPTVFSHQYDDPKHPNCKRIVVVKPDSTVALSGTDGNPGCPEDGSGNVWRLVGEVEGNKLVVDFTPKVRIFSSDIEFAADQCMAKLTSNPSFVSLFLVMIIHVLANIKFM